MIHGIFTLSGSLFQGICTCWSVGLASEDYNSESGDSDFHHGLFLIHSPLLKESFLVFAPPLIYMLKFGGFSDPKPRSNVKWQDWHLEPFRQHTCLPHECVNKPAEPWYVEMRTKCNGKQNHIAPRHGSTLDGTAAFHSKQYCRSTCR